MHFHGVSFGSQHEMWSKQHNGKVRKKEETLEGGKDENVFDIEQGVAISLLVKKEALPQAVYHADLWGDRKEKYRALLEAQNTALEWKELHPTTPYYLFIPQNEELREKFERGWKVTEIFPINSVGIVTARDSLTIHFSEQELWQTVRDFATRPEEDARRKYSLGDDARDWKVALAQQDLQKSGLKQSHSAPLIYRPFDMRYTYYTGNSRGFHCMPRGEVMRHMLAGENVGIITTRLTKDEWSVLATDKIIAHKSASRYDISYLIPLYLYPSQGGVQGNTSLFNERTENFSPKFRKALDEQYKHHFSPEDILAYIYAVLHSPTYRQHYVEFLKIDFPHIPFVDDRHTFETLAKIGTELMQAHLLKTITAMPKVDITKGSYLVEKLTYDEKLQQLYINKEQYFSPVAKEAWDFCIGGYQVLDQYLRSRRDRKLTLDEIETVQDVVKVLIFTTQQMQKIDEIWQP
jgi:predicted helicase